MSWDGNDEVGAGTISIVETKPSEAIKLKLEMKRPMEITHDVFFTFAPIEKGKTKVTWKMTGENGFVGKGFNVFVNTDKMIGDEFEKGLADLKKISEEAAKKAAP